MQNMTEKQNFNIFLKTIDNIVHIVYNIVINIFGKMKEFYTKMGYNLNLNNSFYQYWHEINKSKGNMKALEYFGKSWNFEEVENMITNYAKAISNMNVENGKSITICSPLIPSAIAVIYAANMLGIQVNLVSPELLYSNTKKYLNETDTDILLILDRFLASLIGNIAETNINNIVISSLADDSIDPEAIKKKFSLPDFVKFISAVDLPKNKNFMSKDNFYDIGKKSLITPKALFIPESTAVVLYTGGSTGVPKGVELYNEKINRMAQLYTEVGLDFIPGDRSLLLIPPNHPTSLIHGLISPWACNEGGITQVCQPIYNRFTFAQDLVNYNIHATVAAPSHYATLPGSGLKPGDLKGFKNSFCGGEPIPYELAMAINNTLNHANAPTELLYAYGMSEFGPTAIVSPHVKGLGNKVGKPIPGVTARIVDDKGNELDNNQRGHLQIKAECAMKGYFKNPELTKAFYTEDGFAKTGDIAMRDNDGYYSVPGRATDSFTAENFTKVYLFDIENFIYKSKPDAVLEAEAVGLSMAGTTEKIPVVHVVLTEEYQGKEAEVIKILDYECKNDGLDYYEIPKGYKIKKAFATNPISTKRDYNILAMERTDYYIYNDGKLEKVSFDENGDTITESIDKVDVE